MWTTIIAFVFLLIFFIKSFGSKFSDSSILAHTGLHFASTIASTVATKVNAWVIISSPGFKSNDAIATLKAAVPDVTPKLYLLLKWVEKFFSNSETLKIPFLKFSNPILKKVLLFFRTSLHSRYSLLSTNSYPGIRWKILTVFLNYFRISFYF